MKPAPWSRTFRRAVVIGLLAATGLLPGPSARAGGRTVTIWWNQGFYQAEDQAMRDVVAAYEKQSGDKVDLQLMVGPTLVQKTIAAMTTGDVPDVVYADVSDLLLLAQNAWNDKIVDVSDVVDTQKAEYTPTALLAAQAYDDTTHLRSFYGVPLKQQALHIFVWKPMIEAAGYQMSDVPTSWDKFFDFFEDVQKKLRAKGQRVFGLGYSLATVDTDSTYLFNQFLVSYGGGGLVTPDGRLHTDDPAVRKAAVAALTKLTTPFKAGFVPPGAINWGDPDNNNAFFAKQIVMTPNATISIPVAQMEKTEQYYNEIITRPLPTAPDGKPNVSLVAVKVAFIPKGAKDVNGGKDFLKYLIQPQILNDYLKQARGRWVPVMPSIIKQDEAFWRDPKDPHRPVIVRQEVDGPTMPWFMSFNPGYAEVNAAQIWGKAEANVMQGGMTPDKAVDGAFKQIEAVFAKYPVPKQ